MAERVVFTGKQQVCLEEFEPHAPGEGQAAVRAICSLMSTGTENICFNRLFDAGTHWDRWVQYPFRPGYALIGEVAETGPGVEGLSPGARVALRASHASHVVANAADCFPIPEGLAAEDAAWFALAKIMFVGARKAAYAPGESVMVIGAGPIGQMSLRWAAALGAGELVVVDPSEARLAFARAGGATVTLAKRVHDCTPEEITVAANGRRPSVVIDATGHADVLAEALRFPAKYGRVMIFGDTGSPARQHLTSDVMTSGLTLSAAHDSHNTPEWNNATISRHVFRQMLSGRFPVSGLITHRFHPEQVQAAYQTANTVRPETVGILFDWC